MTGHVVGFGGRALGDEQPKYLNSPRTPLFDKSTLVYGIDLARESARKHDQVVIVEGYMDVIAAHQFGYENVVAAMGTALTDAQVAAVKRLSKRIVLALDADAAGQMATVRSLEAMQDTLDHDEMPVANPVGIIRFERKLNAEISIVQMPEGKDPDELIRKSPESWPGVVQSAKPFLDFYINAVVGPTPVESPTAKAEIISRIGPLLRQIPDRIIQAHYVDLLAARLRIDSRLVNAEIQRGSISRANAAPDPEKAPVASLARFRQPKHASNEDHLMALLLRHRSLCRDIIAMVPVGNLTDERNRELLAVLQSDEVPDLEPLQIIAGLDDWLADYAETLLGQLDGTPSLLPGQIQREAKRTLDKLGKERYDFLVRELSAELQEASKSGDLERSPGWRRSSTDCGSGTGSTTRRRALTSRTPATRRSNADTKKTTGGHLAAGRLFRSGREDSNLRPQRPERCALTGLRYSPRRRQMYHDRTRAPMSAPIADLSRDLS